MIIHDAAQGTNEWLQARAGVVTSSEFKKVLAKGRGNAPSKTRQDYLLIKANESLTGLPVDEGFQSQWMLNGQERESEARATYEMITDNEVKEMGLILDDAQRIGTSVDGLVDIGTLEIKCPKLPTHLNYLIANRCPPAYVAQVQRQLLITDRKWCDFVSYHPDAYEPFFMIRVERDEEYLENLKTTLDAFIVDLDEMVVKLQNLRKAA